MQKTLWQKIKQNHLLMMVICCLAPLILIIGFFSFFKGGNDYWIWLIILLCPAMHFWMMKDHKHEDSSEHEINNKKELYKCSECGLEYEAESWALKCQEWCSEHKSCNLEIIKHATELKVESRKL